MFLTRRCVRFPARRRTRFARWRRTRPFWAGVLLLLAGAEIAAVPLVPLPVLLGLGLGGIAALGIGAALVVAALFLWFLPHARHYVGVHAVILSVASFAVTNLGGFLAGMLLGIAGGAMGFAWTPRRPPRESPEEAGERPPPFPAPFPPPFPPPPAHPPQKTLAIALPLVLLAATAAPGAAARPPAPGPATTTTPRTPPVVTTTRFAPDGFTLARVAEVPTAGGPRRAMVLTMRAASLRDYRLRTRDGGGAELALAADELRLGGRVTLYLTRLTGCVQGALCLTFTPDRLPVPPVAPPFVFMTDVTAEQALVTSGTIGAVGLDLRPAPSPAPSPPASPPPAFPPPPGPR